MLVFEDVKCILYEFGVVVCGEVFGLFKQIFFMKCMMGERSGMVRYLVRLGCNYFVKFMFLEMEYVQEQMQVYVGGFVGIILEFVGIFVIEVSCVLVVNDWI